MRERTRERVSMCVGVVGKAGGLDSTRYDFIWFLVKIRFRFRFRIKIKIILDRIRLGRIIK